jgi:myosin heavy subunit
MTTRRALENSLKFSLLVRFDISASIETYLLEKVTHFSGSGERNYHVFYGTLGRTASKVDVSSKISNLNTADFK